MIPQHKNHLIPTSPIISNKQKLMPKMKSIHALNHFLLACLLLAASQYCYSIPIMVQATESVDFKVGPARVISRSAAGYALATSEKTVNQVQRKISKAPSGPNPVGNRNPPSRP